ncbi:MAG: PAS domain S-box protein [Deltaproteobacteria bacterium]|nr:PAS domain S-box protein [Deltaproteobacteria bacterium]
MKRSNNGYHINGLAGGHRSGPLSKPVYFPPDHVPADDPIANPRVNGIKARPGIKPFWPARLITILFAILFVLLIACSVQANDSKQVKKILLIHSFEPFLPYTIIVNQSIRSTLQAGTTDHLDLYCEYLDLARFPGEAYLRQLRDLLRQKYSARPPDLIFVLLGPALDFTLKYRDEIFPGSPIVFCSLEKRQLEGRHLGPNATGVVSRLDPKGTLDLALQLQPETKQVVVITGTNENDQAYAETTRQAFREYEDRLKFDYLPGASYEQIMATVKHLPSDTIVFYVTMFQDTTGKAYVPREVLSALAQVSSVPIYGMSEQYVGYGIVGGHLTKAQGIAEEAAKVALRILRGEKAADISITQSPNTAMFDWRQLRRWGIDESRLPPDSIVQYRVMTIWETYRLHIIGVITFCALESLLIFILLVQRMKRRKAEQALTMSERKLSFHLEQTIVGVIEWDTQFRVIQWNPAAETIFGYSRAKAMGRYAADLILPANVIDEVAQVWNMLMTQAGGTYNTNENLTKDGGIIICEWFNTPLVAQDGLVIGAMSLVLDITERKRSEEEIIRLNAELEQRVADRTAELQAKNRELEAFTYSVSHDLRAPLRGIDGYSRLLLEDHLQQLDEEGRLFLQTIRHATEQMNQLISDLLAYSRFERRALTPGLVNPRALCEALLTEHAADLENGRFRITIAIPFESVTTDVEGLTQALRNLLDNAIKFIGKVPEPQIEVGGSVNEDTYLLWVRDNGVGFDMRYSNRIFEIFQRLQRVEDYPGTGIGLAIVAKAMQRMGGRVWAESAPGQGATFYLEIPKGGNHA